MILTRNTIKIFLAAGLAAAMCACAGTGAQPQTTPASTPEPTAASGINYMVLVNKLNIKAIRSYEVFGFNVVGECHMFEQDFWATSWGMIRK